MAADKFVQPKGSIVFKLLILVGLFLMFVSILYPRAQWKVQNQLQDIGRLRMENLSYVIREYGREYLRFMDDLDAYLAYIRTDSVLMDPARYEIESLTRDPGAGRDSLLLDFSDEFHLSHFKVETIRRLSQVGDSLLLDSVHVYAIPHPEFDKIPVNILALASESAIHVIPREKNVTDHAMLAYAASQIMHDWIMPDPVPMKSTDALISLPVDCLAVCPASRLPYKLNVNVRSKIEGVAKFLVHKTELDTNITEDTLMVDLFNHKLKTEALANVLVIIGEDSSLIERKDSLLVTHFINRVSEVKEKDEFEVTGDRTITVPADSMLGWNNPLRIRESVFVTHVDSLSRVLKSLEEFSALLPRVSYADSYYVARVDTTGVTIRCPIDSVFYEPHRSIIKRIFGIGPTKNHGYVENGDLSWSETK